MAYSAGIWRWEGSNRVTESCVNSTTNWSTEELLIEDGIIAVLTQFPDATMIYVEQEFQETIYMTLTGPMWFNSATGKRHDAHSAYCLLQTAACQLREMLTAVEEAGQ